MNKLNNIGGYTIAELLIALLITGVLAGAGFEFYAKMHNQTLAQDQITNMQQNSRASIQDIVQNLRNAGYKIGSHAPYVINGDSLFIFYNDTQPIDTILYYVTDYPGGEFQELADSIRPQCLMKKINGVSPVVYSEGIRSVSYTALNASTVQVTLEVQATRPDEDFNQNGGYRTYSAIERVNIRNANL